MNKWTFADYAFMFFLAVFITYSPSWVVFTLFVVMAVAVSVKAGFMIGKFNDDTEGDL
jgi:hypothetical protein